MKIDEIAHYVSCGYKDYINSNSQGMQTIVYNGIIIPKPQSYRDCFVIAQSDYYRYFGTDAGFIKMFLKTFVSPYFSFNFYLRFASYRNNSLRGGVIFWVSKLIKTIIGRRRCLMISKRMPIGYGLYLAHAFGVIINPSAVIGNNCTIRQFVTIGALEGKAASIGDNVYIGPSVSIVEDVVINSNSVVGAGAVVVKDVPESRTVAGVPA